MVANASYQPSRAGIGNDRKPWLKRKYVEDNHRENIRGTEVACRNRLKRGKERERKWKGERERERGGGKRLRSC